MESTFIFFIIFLLIRFSPRFIRVSIVSPDVGFLREDFYSVNLLVVPLWGLYANMVGDNRMV
jgi:hypothetical protein